jgi:DNA modification methylase
MAENVSTRTLPTPALQVDGVSIFHGHVLDILAALPEQSVSCVVTSPPYLLGEKMVRRRVHDLGWRSRLPT